MTRKNVAIRFCLVFSIIFQWLPSYGSDVKQPSNSESIVAGVAALEASEQDFFSRDFAIIQKTFPNKLEAQFQLLLMRSFLNQVVESEFRMALITNNRTIDIVADIVSDSPLFPGLKDKITTWERGLRSTNFDSDTFFDQLLEVSKSLETINNQIALVQDLIKVNKSKDEQTVLTERLTHLLLQKSMLFDLVPANALLLTASEDGKRLYEKINFTTKIINTKRDLKRLLYPEIVKAAKESMPAHRYSAAYAWMHGTQWGRDPRFFLRHSGLREKTLSLLPESQRASFEKIDHQWAVEARLEEEPSKGLSQHLQTAFEELPKLVATLVLQKVHLAANAGFNFAGALKDNWLSLHSDKQALRLGVLFGINSFEEWRARNVIPEYRAFLGGLYEGAIRTIAGRWTARAIAGAPGFLRTFSPAARKFLAAPGVAVSAWANAHKPQLGWLGFTLATSIPSFIYGEMSARQLSLVELMKLPDFQADLATLVTLETVVSFSARRPYGEAFLNTASMTAACASTSQFLVKGRVDYGKMIYVNMYVPIVSLGKSRFLFIPASEWLSRGIIRATQNSLALQHGLNWANSLFWTATNNAVGNVAYSFTNQWYQSLEDKD